MREIALTYDLNNVIIVCHKYKLILTESKYILLSSGTGKKNMERIWGVL